ncbi:Pimeloyl-ACP methyl ester carboxylesterase [Fodinibius salinus]|uniref:Pimeloyl-ACP methyl ester carboxylesterase n=1 Tax=Fodinibius salinus TaxID=860790 RepID=A0A5D3YG28_9BACT|nr:alpha/beta hydrolase [Fodinibius salinus]TYP91953.1 Pimeloyl-ACP methyl ester carboxylesterase [Fodinibius salinus]
MLYYKTYHKDEDADWVVFVHGAGGSSSIWFKQLKAYKKDFNVLLVDLRGHGKSKGMLQQYYEDEYSFKLASQDIIDVLDDAGIEKAHFVGVSLGTIIIRTIGEMQPERVQSLVMCGAIMRLNIRSRFLVSLGHLFKKVVPFMWLYKLFAWIVLPRKHHSESRNLFIREAKKLYKKEFIKWFNLTHKVNPLLKYFREKELKIPTLYVMGSEDYLFLPPVQKMVQNHTNSILKEVEKCGHVVNVEKPDVFNRVSLNFLKNG